MAKITVLLNTRYSSKEGHQILIRVNHKDTKRFFETGYSVPEENWDDTNKKVINTKKSKVADIDLINDTINDMREKANQYERECRRTGAPFLFDKIFEKQADKGSFSGFIRDMMQRYLDEKKTGSYAGARAILNDLSTWKKRDVHFHDFPSKKEARDFNSYLIGRNNSGTTRSRKMTLLYYWWDVAIEEMGAPHLNPFKDMDIKKDSVKRVWLTKDQLGLYSAVRLSTQAQRLARDMFFFSYYCYGMRFNNVIHVKKSDIAGGRVNWKAVKGQKYTYVEIHEDLKKIIDRHIDSPGDYLFPQMNDPRAAARTGVQLHDYICNCDYKVNEVFKTSAKQWDLPMFKFHSARHTFATHAINSGVPIHVLKDMLTHAKIATTERYIAELDKTAVESHGKDFYKNNKVGIQKLKVA